MKERGEEEGRRKGAGEWRGCREIGANGRKGEGEEVRAEGEKKNEVHAGRARGCHGHRGHNVQGLRFRV